MQTATLHLVAMLLLFLAFPAQSNAGQPSEACKYALLWAVKAVDRKIAHAPVVSIGEAIRAENEKNQIIGDEVPEKFVKKFLNDLLSGKYDQLEYGSEFFDLRRPYHNEFMAECKQYF